MLYSVVGNTVKRVDCRRNSASLLPFQSRHQIALICLTASHSLLLAVDAVGEATFFNLGGEFVVGEFNFKVPVRSAAFSQDGALLAIAKESGFWVYECHSLYRSFEPLVLVKKYKSRHSGHITGVAFS